MKETYIFKWEVQPGPSEQQIEFETVNEAKKGVGKIISEYIDIDTCINKIREGYNSEFRNTIADFLYTYIHTPDLIKTLDDIPSGDPNDYIKDDVLYTINHCTKGDGTLDEKYIEDKEYYEKYNFKFEKTDCEFQFICQDGCDVKLHVNTLILVDGRINTRFGDAEGDTVVSLENPGGEKANDMMVKLMNDYFLYSKDEEIY